MKIDTVYLVDALSALVRINSINPEFSAGTTDEREIAAFLAEEMGRLGMAAERFEPEPGRVSVLGRLAGMVGSG